MGNKDSRSATDVYGLQNGPSAASPGASNHTADRRTVAAPSYNASSRHSVPGNISNNVGGPTGGSSTTSSSGTHRSSHHQAAQAPRGSTGAMGAGPSGPQSAPPPLFPAGPPHAPNRGLYQYPGAQAPSSMSSMQSLPASGAPPSYPSYPGPAGNSLPGRPPIMPAPSPPHLPPAPTIQSSSSQAPPRIPRNRTSQQSQSPGAYSVQPNRPPQSQQLYVTVPYGVRPGQQFSVIANGQRLMVTCPPTARPGSQIMVRLSNQTRSAGGTRLPQQQAFMVTVPAGVFPGQQFPVIMPNGQQMLVTCPAGANPGSQVRIVVNLTQNQNRDRSNASVQPMQTFMVQVPAGVRPGQPFALMANGQRVMVTCPPGVRPGQTIRFQLPRAPSASGTEDDNTNIEDIAKTMGIALKYEKDAWVRVLQSDLKLHWVKQEKEEEKKERGQVSRRGSGGFDKAGATLPKDAFVREYAADGTLQWVKASDFSLEPTIPDLNFTLGDLTRAMSHPFKKKLDWFRSQVDDLRVPWEEGHMRITVRRQFLLDDAMQAFESVPVEDMRKTFKFEFVGEPALDAGGVAREFYDQVTEQLFNPDFTLFQYGSVDQMSMQINPASGAYGNDEHLRYFHFAGRLMAKALFDQQIIKAHLALPLYKHLLAWPISIADLEYVDHETYEGLKKMSELEDVSICSLDFTVVEQHLGLTQVVELKESGLETDVINENFDEYILLMLEYRMLRRIKTQLTAFLSGFYEVLPLPLLSVFDFQELELLMCGLPNINMEDWISHTEYGGSYAQQGRFHPIVAWFWEVVGEYDQEQKARLLQFVTGTSRVPIQGFGVLQGSDGNIQRFTITSIPKSQSIFPQSHTCFNRIDLPKYDNKEELKKYLTLAVQMEATGFGME